jgi:membrane-associated phospholipid phosphatase
MTDILNQLDLRFFSFINQTIANDLFDVLCPVIRDQTFLVMCYVAFAVIIYITFPKQFLLIAAAGGLTFLITDQLSSAVIKPLFHRIRPCNDPAINARLIIEHCGSGFSFVSSHATNSFGMATFLSAIFIDNRRCVILLAIWASLICFSQVYVGVHYPGDVITGGLIGFAIGGSIGVLTSRWLTHRKLNPIPNQASKL